MKIVSVVGARPQFIKAGMVTRALRDFPHVTEVLVHTGQHYDARMSQVFLDQLSIPEPAYRLGIGSGNHGAQTGRMLEAVENVLLAERPDWVLVYGDTNSTLAGALAACKLHIPVAHVEAGLRSFDMRMPEEVNRILTDHVSDLLLAPTEAAVDNLQREGIDGNRVRVVGDVMLDAALHYSEQANARSALLEQLGLRKREYLLVTLHRAENTDDPARLLTVMNALQTISKTMKVVFPMHPRTRKSLERQQSMYTQNNLIVLEPLDYLDMILLERNARLIATDSGGVQKEAFFFRVPCVTLRDQTEWVELLELGWNRLAPPTSAEAVVAAIESAACYTPTAVDCPYGDGNAAEKILAFVLQEHDFKYATRAVVA
jgi:UDP-GlcNAc3NAcA epimerase